MTVGQLVDADRLRARLLVRDVVALRLAAERVVLAQEDCHELVRGLRASGVSWAVVADALGIPRRTAMTRYGAGS